MKIYIGADHGGFEFKEEVKQWLLDQKYEVEDCGAFTYDAEDDYPDFSFAVANKVAQSEKTVTGSALGILFCRSGGGVVIAANKIPGIRAVYVNDVVSAQHAKDNNNANVIGLAADWMKPEDVQPTIQAFLITPFSGAERHARRLAKIAAVEAREAK